MELPGARRLSRAEREKLVELPLAARIAAVAAAQGGVVSSAQLRWCGLSDAAISRWCRAGRLHRLFRGVYAVGHVTLGPRGRRFAGVLACGPGAAVCELSACACHAVLEDRGRNVHVAVPTAGGRSRRRGLEVHRWPDLNPEEVVLLDGLPVTSLARTLLDIAASRPHLLTRAVRQAEIQRTLEVAAVDRVLAAHHGANGAPALRQAIAAVRVEDDDVRSDLEAVLLAAMRRAGIPEPLVNATVTVDGRVFRPDFLWPRERLIVEADGWATHGTRTAFEADRERQELLTLDGYEVLRFSHRRVKHDPRGVARTVAARLAARAPG